MVDTVPASGLFVVDGAKIATLTVESVVKDKYGSYTCVISGGTCSVPDSDWEDYILAYKGDIIISNAKSTRLYKLEGARYNEELSDNSKFSYMTAPSILDPSNMFEEYPKEETPIKSEVKEEPIIKKELSLGELLIADGKKQLERNLGPNPYAVPKEDTTGGIDSNLVFTFSPTMRTPLSSNNSYKTYTTISGNLKHTPPNTIIEATTKISDDVTIGDSAQILGKASVLNYAIVDRNAIISHDVVVQDCARVTGFAILENSVVITHAAHISGDAHLTDNVTVRGNARVEGNAQLKGEIQVRDTAYIGGHAKLSGVGLVTKGALVVDNAMVEDRARIVGGKMRDNSRAVDDSIVLSTAVMKNTSVAFDSMLLAGGVYVNQIKSWKKAPWDYIKDEKITKALWNVLHEIPNNSVIPMDKDEIEQIIPTLFIDTLEELLKKAKKLPSATHYTLLKCYNTARSNWLKPDIPI